MSVAHAAARLLAQLAGSHDFSAACTFALRSLADVTASTAGAIVQLPAAPGDATDASPTGIDAPDAEADRCVPALIIGCDCGPGTAIRVSASVRSRVELCELLEALFGTDLADAGPVVLNGPGGPDSACHAAASDLLDGVAVANLLAVPLLQGRNVVGALLLANCPDGYTQDQPGHLSALFSACTALLLWRRQQHTWEQSERRLEEERARLRSVIDSLPDPVTIKDADGRYIDCNQVFADYLGRTRLEVIGRTTWELFPHEVATRFERDDADVFTRGARITRMHWHPRADTGEHALVQIHKRPLHGHDGRTTGVLMAAHDVTELYQKSERERLSAQVFATSSEALAITDADGAIVAVNPALLTMTGHQETDLLGRPWTELDLELGGDGASASLLPPEGMRGEGWLVDADGEHRPVWRSIAAVREDSGAARNFVLAYLNIAELVDAREHLDHIAHHDALTGLPNRMHLQKELGRMTARARVVPTAFALLFVDVDSFKTVNDSLGHSRGDQLLRGIAVRLRQVLRESDLVARIGGDEFVLLLPGIGEAASAERVASKVMAAFIEPFEVGETMLFQTPSIGISLFPSDGEDAETLIRNADAAMYAAKAAGRNCFRFYASELTVAASERLTFETAMRRALGAEEFELYFQPIHDFGDGRITAAEVLLRWDGPELGNVSPERFIPMAEASGLIVQIGDWVLARALAQLASWRAQGRTLERLAVNVAIRQLERHDFAARVAQLLRRHDLPTDSLELEITETALMQQDGRGGALEQLRALRDLGVQIAIDDFGTGYSSLSRLQAMPVDRIKIDRSFFVVGETDEAAGSIMRAIAAIAQELGLRLTAEGVESEQLLRRARALGCDEAQGFHLGRPMPAIDFQRLLSMPRERVGAL